MDEPTVDPAVGDVTETIAFGLLNDAAKLEQVLLLVSSQFLSFLTIFPHIRLMKLKVNFLRQNSRSYSNLQLMHAYMNSI